VRPTLALSVALVLVAASGLPAPAGANDRPVVLTASSGRVPLGEEEQKCFRRRMRRKEGMEVSRVQMFVRGGSHHTHLYRPYGGAVEYPPRDCPFAVDFSKWQLVAASQNAVLDWVLPPGVAINFSPRQPLLVQTHFVNAGALGSRGRTRAKIVLHPAEPGSVRAHGGALFAQDRVLEVPPGRTTVKSRCAFTGESAEGRDLTVMAFTGHYHFRGVVFEVYRTHADGSLGEMVYRHEGYSDPVFKEYPPDRPLVFRKGEGFEWWCTYQNDTTETFKFGPNTQMNEHCNLFGFYYPTETPQEAIDCIHLRDEQGQEQDVRIVAR
jgi:hypothetical protein